MELTPDWQITLEFVRAEILSRLESEAGKSAWFRHSVRWAPLAAGVAALIVYGVVRVNSAVSLDAPLASHAGLTQRAEALHKVVRYGDIMGGARRNGLVMSVLLWPIEPSEAELAAGQEFAGLTVEGARFLAAQGQPCAALSGMGEQLSEAEVAFVDAVAERMKAEAPHAVGEDLDHLLRVIASSCGTS
jgi:hypothetical protein